MPPCPLLKIALPMRGSGYDVLIKVIALFLAGMAVLAMFGKIRFPGQDRLAAAKCKACGRYRIGKGPCVCGRGKG